MPLTRAARALQHRRRHPAGAGAGRDTRRRLERHARRAGRSAQPELRAGRAGLSLRHRGRRNGRRFFDEGGGLVHETWECSRATAFRHCPVAAPMRSSTARLLDVPDWQRAIRSEVPPHRADTLDALARGSASMPAISPRPSRPTTRPAPAIRKPSTPRVATGSRRARALAAAEVELGARDRRAAVSRLADDRCHRLHVRRARHQRAGGGAAGRRAIPGLYAAGEITGHFHVTAPNAVSVLRAFVFGRIAGQQAVAYLGAAAR